MRCAYLAQDRADIFEAIKCLARGMSKPRTGHMIQLKRVARYLKRSAKEGTTVLRTRTEQSTFGSPCAQRLGSGDIVTRRSTTGVIVRRGQHLLRHSSTVRNVIGLSCADREYYALTKGGCSGLGLQSLFADWNLKLQLSLHIDSSAKAIASRRGTGKSTGHIQTRMLWLEERAAAKHLRAAKVASESNLADMLTKALGRSKIEEFCAEIGQTEPRAETLDKGSKVVKKTKEVKFAVEANEIDETVKHELQGPRTN